MLPISMVVAHFVGDFLLQSDWMALNKSKNTSALTTHCVIYSLCFLPFGILFTLVTFLLHFIVDAITSKMTSKLWFIDTGPVKAEALRTTLYEWATIRWDRRHWFFVMIGFDQLIHYVSLWVTVKLLF